MLVWRATMSERDLCAWFDHHCLITADWQLIGGTDSNTATIGFCRETPITLDLQPVKAKAVAPLWHVVRFCEASSFSIGQMHKKMAYGLKGHWVEAETRAGSLSSLQLPAVEKKKPTKNVTELSWSQCCPHMAAKNLNSKALTCVRFAKTVASICDLEKIAHMFPEWAGSRCMRQQYRLVGVSWWVRELLLCYIWWCVHCYVVN